jgi:hypothetical protein
MWSKTLQRPIPLTRSGIPAWRKKTKGNAMEQQQQQMTKNEFDPKCKGMVSGLRATFPKPYKKGDIEAVLKTLGADYKTSKPCGTYGAKKVAIFTNDVKVYSYDDKAILEIEEAECKRLSAWKGGRSTENRILNEIHARERWLSVLRSIENCGGKLTYFAIRVIDELGFFQETELNFKIAAHEYVSPLRDARDVMREKYHGSAYLLGNGKTRTLALYYDYPWQAIFEVEYHGDTARIQGDFFKDCLSHETEKWFFLTSLSSVIEFKEKNSYDDKHRSAAKKWGKWNEFLAGVGKADWLATPNEYDAIERKEKWLRDEASKAIAQVALAKGTSFENVAMSLYCYGKRKLTEDEFNDINAYRVYRGHNKIPGSMMPFKTSAQLNERLAQIRAQEGDDNQ